jgi:hypothetical protein
MSHTLQREFVLGLATDIMHLLINLLPVNVVIAPRKAARNRQSVSHPRVIVRGLVPNPEHHASLGTSVYTTQSLSEKITPHLLK